MDRENERAALRVDLGPMPLDRAIDVALGPDTLRAVHGPSLRMPRPEFDPVTCARTFDFEASVPWALRPVLGGAPSTRVTVCQTLLKSPGRWIVHGELQFPGSVLVDIRPTFELSETDGRATLLARVRHRARLPPPLRGVAEAFLARRSAAEFERLAAVLADRAG